MSDHNHSENFTQLSKDQVVVSKETNSQSDVFTTTTPVDILICGTCSSHFSDLKLFIDHKQNCGSSSLAVSTSNNESIHSSPLPLRNMSPTHQPIASTSVGSNVSLSVGTPHVILQTSTGVAQMYRIVLEPSLHGAQISTGTSLGSSHSILENSHYHEPGESSVISKQNSYEAVKLHNMGPLESSWAPNISNTELHAEEEDVATFLATQLAASQSAPHHSKRNNEDHSTNVSSREDELLLEEVVDNHADGKSQGLLLSICNERKCTNLEPHIKRHHIEAQEEPSTASTKSHEIKLYNRRKLSCTYENCSYQTFYQKDMVRHTRSHTGEKPFECTFCTSKFSRQDKLKVHIRIHKNERPYACKVPGCYYSAIEKAHLNKHNRIHTDERPYKCQMCPYAARDGSQLTVHLRSHTGDTPFHCQTEGCPATFKTSSDLRRHERLHTGEKPFKCSECDYASALKSNLKVHFRINHYKTVRFGCRVCGFSGTTRKQLKEHELTHPDSLIMEEAEELICGEISTQYRAQGFPRAKNRLKPACMKNFRCEHCGCGFVRGDSYRSHIRQHQRCKGAVDADQRKHSQMTKQESKPEIQNHQNLQGNCLAETSSNEQFSSYVITIDGISSVYPPGEILSKVNVIGDTSRGSIEVDLASEVLLKEEATKADTKNLS